MDNKKKIKYSLFTSIPIGCLGGLIGLGGAEFRLPFLVELFKYSVRQAVALNLAISIITVVSSLIFRLPNSSFDNLKSYFFIIIAFIVSGMLGAYIGTHYLSRISEKSLEKAIFVLLLFIGGLLIVEYFYPLVSAKLNIPFFYLIACAGLFGTGIGIVSSLLGVAGGELIIPTLILFFGVDAKMAGTMSLIISFPTMLVGIWRHASSGAFTSKQDLSELVIPMGIGSIIGAFIGGLLVVYVDSGLIKLILGCILIISAAKMFFKNK